MKKGDRVQIVPPPDRGPLEGVVSRVTKDMLLVCFPIRKFVWLRKWQVKRVKASVTVTLTNSTNEYDWRDRPATDFFPTPDDVTEALIRKCQWDRESLIWEPAAGQGHMVRVFEREGYDVYATDIQTGTDFTKATVLEAEIIVTNPPFIRAEDFIRTARRLEPSAFAFLLKSQYWHASTRLKLFNEIRPAFVFPLSWRPDFLFGAKSKSPTMEVQWCVWVYPFDNKVTEFDILHRPIKGSAPLFDEKGDKSYAASSMTGEMPTNRR